MKWSYRLARVAGIDVRIHITFLLLPLWFGYQGWLRGGATAALQGSVFILALFFCVLLHEFGHALAGRRCGIRTRDITLLPIGGVARMENIPEKPSQELGIAVAGPAVNVAIGTLLALALAATGGVLSGPESGLRLTMHELLFVNVALVVFNLIPAFPMDGGRVLRALLAMGVGHLRATLIAARLGQGIAVLFAVAGFFGNPMLVLIAMFVFSGAQQELRYAQQRQAFESMRREAANTEPPILWP